MHVKITELLDQKDINFDQEDIETDFRRIRAKLARFFAPDEIQIWLEQPHFLLNNHSPDNFIRVGRTVEVHRLIDLVFDKNL